MPPLRSVPRQILIALDQFLNTLLGGWADETLSARCWRLRERGRAWSLARKLVDALFFWTPNHCRASFESEISRNHLPPALRPER